MSNDLYNWNLQEGAPFGDDSPLEALADEVGSWLISENIHFRPAPAQSREEEDTTEELITLVFDLLNKVQYSGMDSSAAFAIYRAAALRSRQSPQAGDVQRLMDALEIAARDFMNQNGALPEWWVAVRDLYHDRPETPKPIQSSPQGEDDEAFRHRMVMAFQKMRRQFRDEGRTEWLDDAEANWVMNELRGRLASAQSSAQGEEAREMREVDDPADLVAYWVDDCGWLFGRRDWCEKVGWKNLILIRSASWTRAALGRNTKE